MGAARIAPGLALLLCCPVLSSAYALVSHPLTLPDRFLLGLLRFPERDVSRAQRLEFSPGNLNLGGGPSSPGSLVPAVSGMSGLWGADAYKVSLFLKPGVGVPGLEICVWDSPVFCF